MLSEEQPKYKGKCRLCGYDLYEIDGELKAANPEFCSHEIENSHVHPTIRDVLAQFRRIAA